MRTTTQTFDAALQKELVNMTGRVTAYKSRLYFEEINLNTVNELPANLLRSNEHPLPEAISWNTELGEFITVSIDVDNVLVLCRKGFSQVRVYIGSTSSYATTDGRSRPGIYENSVYYYDGVAWQHLSINMALFSAGTENCVSAISPLSILTTAGVQKPGAIYPLNSVSGILFYIDEGAIATVWYGEDSASNAIYSICPGRMFHPTVLLDSVNDDDLFSLHFSSAVLLNGSVYCYMTVYTGEVKVIAYADENWSDILTAIPSDISSFRVGNSFVSDGSVFICGMFNRKKEFLSDVTYTILSKSTDGFTFSLDRKTLCSLVERRFLCLRYGNVVVFSSGGIFYEDTPHYQLVGEATESVTIENLTISGDSSSFSVSAKAGSETYYDHKFIKEGYYSKLEIGVKTLIGIEYIKYHDTVISSVTQGIKDGVRDLSIQLVPDAKWHTSVMTYPFYMEFAGKSGKYDPTKELNNLYLLDPIKGKDWSFGIDFWGSESPSASVSSKDLALPNSHYDYKSADLLTFFTKYPEFGADATYKINIYGWSRAGKPDQNPNVPDNTDVNGPNATFQAILYLEDVNGVETEILVDQMLSSNYANPPQTYFVEGARDGSYPVQYTINNPGEGTKIKNVGVRVSSSTIPVVFHVERVEMPKIVGNYLLPTGATPGMHSEEAKKRWTLVQSLDMQITTDNAIDGNKITSAPLKDGYCYAIVVTGQVGFTRGATDYVQDPEFWCSSDTLKPTWGRSYPPGTGPNYYSSIDVTSTEYPQFGVGPSGVLHASRTSVLPVDKHNYLFKHSDTRFKDSIIKATEIPYVYSNGVIRITVAMNLTGSGAITNIDDGHFHVYIFESPVKFTEFDLFNTPSTTGEFEIVQNNRSNQIITVSPLTSPHTYYKTEDNAAYSVGAAEGGMESAAYQEVIIKPPAGVGPISVNVTVGFDSFKVNHSFGDTFINSIYNKAGGSNIDSLNISADRWSDHTLYSYKNYVINSGKSLSINNEWWYPYPYASVTRKRTVIIEIATIAAPEQVPIPPYFILDYGSGKIVDDYLNKKVITRQKGIPQILFSTVPYTAFNFEAVERFKAKGDYSYVGIIGLAEDENNYTLGYCGLGVIGIAKVRDGKLYPIHEESMPSLEDNHLYDIRFWHRDGLFGVDVKDSADVWQPRSSANNGIQLKWLSSYGAIATSDDIFHVGVYAYINPPRFRTVGFLSSSSYIPVLPRDVNPETNASDYVTLFPDSGRVDIDGAIYTYSGKNKTLETIGISPMGPFQIRNTTEWLDPFNDDLNGEKYPPGKAIEILQFRWLNGTTNSEDYKNAILATSSGFNWLIDKTQWKVWITTNTKVVWLRNRARHYAPNMPDYYPDANERIFLADGLSGAKFVGKKNADYLHEYGSFVYLDNKDYVSIHGFSAYNGEHDQSISMLLSSFCKIAGTGSEFIGDVETPSLNMTSGVEYTI